MKIIIPLFVLFCISTSCKKIKPENLHGKWTVNNFYSSSTNLNAYGDIFSFYENSSLFIGDSIYYYNSIDSTFETSNNLIYHELEFEFLEQDRVKLKFVSSTETDYDKIISTREYYGTYTFLGKEKRKKGDLIQIHWEGFEQTDEYVLANTSEWNSYKKSFGDILFVEFYEITDLSSNAMTWLNLSGDTYAETGSMFSSDHRKLEIHLTRN